MRDLAPYRPVSSMPPVTRDLSVAVDAAGAHPGQQNLMVRVVLAGGNVGVSG